MNEMETLRIVKIGGNVIDDAVKLEKFLMDFSSLAGKKILVHGGGKIATSISQKLGIETKMEQGRRLTDEETLKVVTMVYAGLINKNIVAKLNALGLSAIGLCGADGNLIPATKRKIAEVDFGYVGDVETQKISADKIVSLLAVFDTIVLAPITSDDSGQLLNTNADTIASCIAIALSKYFNTELIFCFEKNGLLQNVQDEKSLIKNLNEPVYQQLKQDKVIHSGMLPKVENAFNAIKSGVQKVIIGNSDHLKELINLENGTHITA